MLAEVDEVGLRPLVPLALLTVIVLIRLQRVLVNQLPRIARLPRMLFRHVMKCLNWLLYVLLRILARHMQLRDL